MPINVTRVYRSSDKHNTIWNSRAFGLGTSLNYDIFLYSSSQASGQFTDAEVVLPDSGMINCIRSDTNPPTDYVDATFVCNQQPTGVWFGSTIKYNSSNSGWDLLRTDGTTYHFGFNSPLQTITDRYNNQISIVRGGPTASICSKSVPANSISTISSSNNRSISFCYDDNNYAAGISKITDNSPSVGKLVTYTYGTNKQLQTVTQTSYNSKATTTYTYNQGSPAAGIGNITQITANYACSGTNCSSPLQFSTHITYAGNALGNAVQSVSSTTVPADGYQYSYTIPTGWTVASQVKVTLPDSSKRALMFDQCGYVTNDLRNDGVGGIPAEYTVFTRGLQPIGSAPSCNPSGSSEFVGQVQEQDNSHQTVRQTSYQYDGNGNVTSMSISPEPGAPDNVSTDCCSTSATWNYTYDSFNRLLTAVEPLAFNGIGTTYTYDDTPSAPKVTVTDPLVRGTTTVAYNPQGQPISVTDSLGTGSTSYFSNGDVQSVTDPAGKTTNYVTDPDGRVKQITSPLNELTTFSYDTLDDVTDIFVDPSGLNLHTNYTYDLIGEILTETTPLGNTTTYTRSAGLTKLVVKDARNFTTTTVLDSQGGATNYTDQRGDVTSYIYDSFGRISVVGFNGSFDVQVGYAVGNGDYDALDRPLNIDIPVAKNGGLDYVGPSATYDSLDNLRSEIGTHSMGGTDYQVQYQYDSNGRRTQLQPTLPGTTQPTTNYGYDCDDELVSMSNDGTTLPSCSPSNNVTNGDPSTQVAFYYEDEGVLLYMTSNGVLAWNTGIDADGRITETDYYSLLQFFQYGSLTYAYDADGRVIDKGNSLAAVSLPPSDTAAYSPTDQLTTFSPGGSTNPDHANNIINDPALGLTYTWNARNQLSAMSPGSVSDTYDALGRRKTLVSGTSHNLSLLHDGSSVIGSFDSVSGNTWSFLPGGLAGSLTSGGTTKTYVPLLDKDGTTIALVNTANVNSPPETTFTYDPSGVSTVSGVANSFPFLYQGLEHEVSDPGQLYFEPSGNVYNPQLQRDLSLIGPQGIFGPPSGFGNGGFSSPTGHGSSAGGPSKLVGALSDLAVVGGAFASAESLSSPSNFLMLPLGGGSEIAPIAIPIPLLSNLLCLVDCGSSNGDQPRRPPHETSQTYLILGIPLIHGQQSAATFIAKSDDAPQSAVVLARYIAIPFSRLPQLPQDVKEPPGHGFTEKRGPNWYNPQTGQSLHPDPTHGGTKGPHYDLHSGLNEPKGKVSLRQFFDEIQFWTPDVEEWISVEGPTLVGIE